MTTAARVARRFLGYSYSGPEAQHPVVRKYNRFLTRLGLKVEIIHNINIVPIDPSEMDLPMLDMTDQGAVGTIMTSPKRPAALSPECLADFKALQKKVRKRGLGIQVVDFVRVRDDFQGKGLGKILYELALYNASDGWGTGQDSALVPASCVGSTTSGAASSVWKALARDHIAVGNVLFYKR